MINRISEIPFWGPEEQIRKFVNQHDEPDKIPEGETQQSITQERIANLDDIYQKQLIWSYGKSGDAVQDAYFYQDWCPMGDGSMEDPKWQIEQWEESIENLTRGAATRTFDYRDFKGYFASRGDDEMPTSMNVLQDEHALEQNKDEDTGLVNMDAETLRHNIMRSYLEVSEWLGDGATQYGSHNGYVSRKMSLAWLFNAIRALINWKINRDANADLDIHPLMNEGVDDFGNPIRERFLYDNEKSTVGILYEDEPSLDQMNGCCQIQTKQRSKDPDSIEHGRKNIRGNLYCYGERAYFYTHNSFIGECRFFHNARFLGQTTFDKEIAGTALRSRWADLAEYREADFDYEPGTLVMFGGEKEITLSRDGVANAIVTTKPGLILNGDEPSKDCIMVGIALIGTVPVRVSSRVRKFDRLVADKECPGCARRRKWWEFWKKPIAIALESFPAGGTINCMTKMEI